MPAATAVPPVNSPALLVAGARFFIRRIPLAPNAPAAPQIELALETLSPFPLEQLFHGSVTDKAGQHALIYAAYRRNFSAAEQESWDRARTVIPEFLLWAFTRRPNQSGAQLRRTATGIEIVAWDEASELPVLVLSRESHDDEAESDPTPLLLELKRRTGIEANDVELVEEPLKVAGLDRDGLALQAGKPRTALIAPTVLADADIRDKTELTVRRRAERRNTVLWRLFAVSTLALAACLLVEITLAGGRAFLAAQRQKIADNSEAVRAIESAQLLATKLEKMTSQQLRPFEMLALINQPRPRSIEFQRISTSGPLTLQIEAQTAEAGDLRIYEDALRKLGTVERVELRDPRMRSGRTTFQLEVTFKPNWTGNGGGA
ncbi:MAG: hypothetical protein H7A44_03895 [Opitutaceae bacterium]|nr:hypothetical protein [Opitutaceae bacterium]